MHGSDETVSKSTPYRLRELRQEDLELVLEWRNSDRIRAIMFTDQTISREDHYAWFDRLQQNPSASVRLFEAFSQPAGLMNITVRDSANGVAYWGFYLGRADLPKGTGTEMGLLALRFAFEKLNVRKLCGEVIAMNEASLRFHDKLGFVQEGRLRKHVKKNGRFEDVVLYAMLQEDYRREDKKR